MDMIDNPIVNLCLPTEPAFHSRFFQQRAELIVGWGKKWSGQRAIEISRKTEVPFRLLEDGFLRSYERKDISTSLVIDRQGIYYDANAASCLETAIPVKLTASETSRAKKLISLWQDHRLSKYNASPEYCGQLPDRYVLVVDQTFGDASISYGLANEASFERMLAAALAENPTITIVVKSHPDSTIQSKRGYLGNSPHLASSRVQVITEACHPTRLIEFAEATYTVTSQVGFEALIWGKRVRTFGMPFYAGWGLTQDDLAKPIRRGHATLEQLVHAALVKYPRYIDPVTMQICEVEQAMDHIALQRYSRKSLPCRMEAIGFSRWKRQFITKFMPDAKINFRSHIKTAKVSNSQSRYLVWGSNEPTNLPKDAKTLRVEDGFLRSSGLGADLVRPLSLVIDDVGIYYDCTKESRLERILSQQVLSTAQLQRARNLRKRICNLQVTKYNFGRKTWTRPENAKHVLLVVGQVEDDASIKYGSPLVRTNLTLLRNVREENPDSYIIYKPHPDVATGLRLKGENEQNAFQFCDEVLTHQVSTGHLFEQIDALHTMTSLMGFEALLRGVHVTCHGIPFYAGWGLTQDKLVCPSRQRQISLDELVYGALITYPRYFNYESDCFVTPEQALEQLAGWSSRRPSTRSWHRKLLRKALVYRRKLQGTQQ